MTDFVYAPGAALDTRGSAAVVAKRLAILDIVSLSASDLDAVATETPGTHDVRPVSLVGAPADEWQVESGQTSNGVQGDGTWQFTVNYVDVGVAAAQVTLLGTIASEAETRVDGFAPLTDRQRSLYTMVRLVSEGLIHLMESTHGLDHGTWPEPLQAWEADYQTASRDIRKLWRVERTRKIEVQKRAEIAGLTTMQAVRAYEADANWLSDESEAPVRRLST